MREREPRRRSETIRRKLNQVSQSSVRQAVRRAIDPPVVQPRPGAARPGRSVGGDAARQRQGENGKGGEGAQGKGHAPFHGAARGNRQSAPCIAAGAVRPMVAPVRPAG